MKRLTINGKSIENGVAFLVIFNILVFVIAFVGYISIPLDKNIATDREIINRLDAETIIFYPEDAVKALQIGLKCEGYTELVVTGELDTDTILTYRKWKAK